MSGLFLSRVFSSVHLPDPVMAATIDAYIPRYPFPFAQNTHLGPLAPRVVKALLGISDTAPLQALLEQGSPEVLGAIVASTSLDAETIMLVIQIWDLSLAHRLALARAAATPLGVDYALYGPRSFPSSSTAQSPEGDMRTVVSTPPLPDPSHQSCLRYPLPLKLGLPSNSAGLDLSRSVTALAQWTRDQFERYGSAIEVHLGLGDTPCSLRSWMLFFALCEDDPDISVISIIASARRLAIAETSGHGL